MKKLSNKRELLAIFYPSIIDWATALDYSIPSIATLAKYVVKFDDVVSFASVYNGKPITAIGTHQSVPMEIVVASVHTHCEIMSTLIHEFAHAVQFFNLGDKFHGLYRLEAGKNLHAGNKYEDEARRLQRALARRIQCNSIFREEHASFEFKFYTEHKVKPLIEYYNDYRPAYTPEDCYNNKKIFRTNRSKWWLNR